MESQRKELIYVSNKSYKIGYRDGVNSVKPTEWDDVDYDEEIADLCDGSMSLTSKDIARHFYELGQRCYKPAEWNEEDEKRIQRIYDFLWKNRKGDTDTIYQIEKDADWLKSLPERFNLQPKQEWSEEDEETLACVISVFGDFAECKNVSVPPASAKRYLKRLKSLHPQPREEIYRAAKHDIAIRFMNYLDENGPEGKMSLSNGECEDIDKAFKENDWAKIMQYVEKYRPSWKPSKEQMQYLLAVINNPNNAGAESCHLTLGSLYNDLKKLK